MIDLLVPKYIVTLYSGPPKPPSTSPWFWPVQQGYRDGNQNSPVDYDCGQRKGKVPANPLDQLGRIGSRREVGQIPEGKGNVGDRMVHGRDGGEKVSRSAA